MSEFLSNILDKWFYACTVRYIDTVCSIRVIVTLTNTYMGGVVCMNYLSHKGAVLYISVK